MFDRANANEGRQDFRIQRFLHVDQQMCRQLQPNTWYGQQEQEGLFESWMIVNQAANFLINGFDVFVDLLDHVLVNLSGKFRSYFLTIDGDERILVSSQLD